MNKHFLSLLFLTSIHTLFGMQSSNLTLVPLEHLTKENVLNIQKICGPMSTELTITLKRPLFIENTTTTNIIRITQYNSGAIRLSYSEQYHIVKGFFDNPPQLLKNTYENLYQQ